VSRRAFVGAAALGAAALGTAVAAPALVGLARKAPRPVAGGFADDGHAAGHALRGGARGPAPAVRRRERRAVVVVGGGAAGLSAAWWMLRRGFTDFAVLELAREPGGNARSGENAVGAFPWGAHYVPIPGPRAERLRLLLGEMGVLGADGRWRERDQAFAPRERVFVHGRWREGLEEAVAASPADRAELARLAERAAELRATGAFTIPMALGAPGASPLDALSAEAWLAREGFRSPAARWLVDYACRDDFGTRARDASAWAALHYFAARDGGDGGERDPGPLTWPEGNGRLVRWLAARAAGHVHPGAAVGRVERAGAGAAAPMRVVAGDTEWACEAVVWAAPTFVAAHVVDGAPRVPWGYAPWLVANVTLARRPGPDDPDRDAPEAWDNVIADSPSLGYVVATHQRLQAADDGRTVWTWYHAAADGDPAAARRRLLAMTWRECADHALDDLARAHPRVREVVERVDVMRYGHAMPRPEPGFLARHRPWWDPPRDARVFWANADVSGLSLFEEAQDRGVRAAERALALVQRGG
jgi:phytoene dehydrogenase-like protein